jgi:hypothetical protein
MQTRAAVSTPMFDMRPCKTISHIKFSYLLFSSHR